jgi:hypothetical protein
VIGNAVHVMRIATGEIPKAAPLVGLVEAYEAKGNSK